MHLAKVLWVVALPVFLLLSVRVAAGSEHGILPGSLKPKLRPVLGHGAPVYSVAISASGKHIASAGHDGVVCLWDAETGGELRRLQHPSFVQSVCFSPDGRHVVTGDWSGMARLWSAATGKETQRFEGHGRIVWATAFSPDGRYVLTGGSDRTVCLWSCADGREVRRFSGHEGGITAVAFSRDGRWVVTGSEDGTARSWDVSTGRELRRFEGHSLSVGAVVISPNGRYLLTGSTDDTARLWDATTGRELRRFVGHTQSVEAVGFSPDGRLVFTASEDATARMWEIATAQEQQRFEGHTAAVESLSVVPNGRHLVTGSVDGTIRIWEVGSGRQARRLGGQAIPSRSVAFSPNDRYLLTGGTRNLASLWNLQTGREVLRLDASFSAAKREQLKSRQSQVSEAGNSNLLAAQGDEEKERRFTGPDDATVAFSPDGAFLLIDGEDNILRLWDLVAGREICRFKGHREYVDGAKFSPAGDYFFSTALDNTGRMWNTETGKEVWRVSENRIFDFAFSPDGRFIATPGGDNAVQLRDVRTGREERRFVGHVEGISRILFSPNGSYLITTGLDKTVRLWNVTTAQELGRLSGLYVSVVIFSPDGRYFLTGTDATPRLWEVAALQEVSRFEGHTDEIIAMAFSKDAAYLATASMDDTIRLWEVATGRELGRVEEIKSSSLAFSGSSLLLAIGCEDGSARLWNARKGEEFAKLVSFDDGTWAVMSPEGRFDTNNLEEIQGLYWVVPDDPMRALPIEIFMRDYYEPRLLPRVLAGEQFKPIRSLGELNRAQAKVEIKDVRVEDSKGGTVTVEVEVQAANGNFERDGKEVPVKTGVYDLRLFRDGQLVAQMPPPANEPSGPGTSWEEELRQWRGAHKIIDFETGKKTLTFRGIRLPRRAGLKDVEFSTYAFNEDRVKSATARTRFAVPKEIAPRQGRAYVITVGVNAYENADWDLHYAAKDAQYFSEVITPLLKGTKDYSEVVVIPLISDWTEQNGKRKITINDATKPKFKAVLDLLAGRRVLHELRSSIPNAEKLQPVQPEDLVLIAFSSHGYTDQSGAFYLFPYDIGSLAGGKLGREILRRTISSDELSNWLRDIDASEMVMIIDACHSAASVEGTGFKPGPMGSRGLGQLAYDKGMRILASTRADDVAWESPLTKQGLLSYALVQNGLVKKQADFDPQDKRILLSEWLKYGVKRVPELYEEVRSGQVKGAEEKAARLTSYRRGVKVEYDAGDEKSSAGQQPSLFDFRRAATSSEPVIMRISQ